MLYELRQKIYSKVSAVVKSFYIQAPIGEKLPYCVFNIISIPHDYDSATNIETINFQVSVFANKVNDLDQIQGNIIAAIEGNASYYNTTGMNALKIERKIIRYDFTDNIYSVHIEYNLIISN